MTTYRAAIVGLRTIGARPPDTGPGDPAMGHGFTHSHAAAYAHHPNVDVVAVCDLTPSLLDSFRSSFEGIWPGVKTYADYSQMLEREHIDILSVATPDHRHAQIVVDAAEAGVRAIFCEKPIATTIADANRMIETCERNGVVLSIDHSRRWYPAWRAARAQVGNGPLGRVHAIVATLAGLRAGMIFRTGTHLIDLVRWFADSDPDWVVGTLDPGDEGYGVRYAAQGGREPALEPGGTGLVSFKNGVRATIICSKALPELGIMIDVFAENGLMRIHDLGGASRSFVEVWSRPEGWREIVRWPLPTLYTERADLPAAVAELVHVMEHGGAPSCPPRESRDTLAIILAMLQSQAAGHVPISFPIEDR